MERVAPGSSGPGSLEYAQWQQGEGGGREGFLMPPCLATTWQQYRLARDRQNVEDMPVQMDDEREMAVAEARSIIEEFGAAGDAAKIERLADGLFKSLKSYDQGPDFGRLVIKQLRLIARETRQGIG